MTSLVLLGGGRMGGAMLAGWVERGWSGASITVVEPDCERGQLLHAAHGVKVANHCDLIEHQPDILVVAIKPQTMADALPTCKRFVTDHTLVLSIAAGTLIRTFEHAFGPDVPVVRAMPNTPAAIGEGITVLCANSIVTLEQSKAAEGLLAAVGDVAWVEDEELMHLVTAVSGSGPAYVFYFVEALTAAGVAKGLSRELASKLARKTVIGAAKLMDNRPDDVAALRQQVTSPGGTTEAALQILMGEKGLEPVVGEAVGAAVVRSRALG